MSISCFVVRLFLIISLIFFVTLRIDLEEGTGNGWMAVLFAVIAVLVYIAGLMCSHLGAFRIATNLRIQTMEHIVKLPLGFAESFGSGKLRKIVNESSAATETRAELRKKFL